MKDSKSEKKVSIVIPIHNSADKLKKCLDSVMSQTETDFEVLMIDDGSTDSSGEIANSYTADSRFKYYFQENAGVSVARNRGLSMSSGKWIAFVDSDDSLVDEYLSTLLAAAEDTVDIVCCGCQYLKNGAYLPVDFYESPAVFMDEGRKYNGQYKVVSKKELYLLLMDNQYKAKERRPTAIGVPWAKLYKREFLISNRLQFDVRLKRLQDNIFNMYAFEKAGCIKYISEYLYNYSVEHIQDFRKKYDPKAPGYYYLLFKLRRDFMREHGFLKDPQIWNKYCKEVMKYSGNMLKQYYVNEKNEKPVKTIRKELKDRFSDELFTEVIEGSKPGLGKTRIILAQKGCYYSLVLLDRMGKAYNAVHNAHR